MQMVDNAPKPFWSGWVKFAGLALAGGVTGFVLARTVGQSFEAGGALSHIAGSEPALLVAAMYILMGVFVGLGTLSPRIGAAVLNVEDADEVREQAPVLLPSAIGCVLIGLSLVALALGGPAGPLSPTMAVGIGAVSLAIATVVTVKTNRRADELMRALFRETGAASFYLIFITLGGWAAAAQIGLVPAPSAIAVLTLLWAMPLVASFWVIGRRGMLKPRG
ncbi:hypothetical protein A6F68_01473 [Tsuneonella dongtanensis]|uniref:Uncharacterized protein n=1 Tax=Tsuneonella dongtanensis TaxID=692370 RepID=A0A1B2ACW0_9SPHN|nr:hypothetical protein [Tsuneonella dongtanensis]ANY19989.1 hypothetical protein A6F68_01473 [Tsuneonella dongtanensis]